jgi:hypothetical protein
MGFTVAVGNSAPGVEPPPRMPVPRWWWVCNATPWGRMKAAAPQTDAPELTLPDPGTAVGFDAEWLDVFERWTKPRS